MDNNYLRRSYIDQEESQLKKEIEKGFEHDDLQDDMAIGEKLKEENYYKYHENVSPYDPRG